MIATPNEKAFTGLGLMSKDEIIEAFKLNLHEARDLRARKTSVKWDMKTLAGARETHILVPAFPVSLAELHHAYPDNFDENAWYISMQFARAQPESDTYLMRLGPHPGSLAKNYLGSLELLSSQEVVPNVVELVFCILAAIRSKKYVYHGYSLWTRDSDHRGMHLSVVVDKKLKIRIQRNEDKYPHYKLGLASNIKPHK